MRSTHRALALSGLLLGACLGCAQQQAKPSQATGKIEHIIVIFLENHSFDSLYGHFPGADGLDAAPPERTLQTDLQGKPYAVLPKAMDTRVKPAAPDPRFPAELPNRPFDIGQYVPAHDKIGDLMHRFYQHQDQIHGGRMDRFAAISDAGGLTMGHYDGQTLPLWQYARRYTLADHFFQAAFGGSFLNHFWLVCACTPRFEHAPAEITATLDGSGALKHDGAVTPDGYAVNTLLSAQSPYRASDREPAKRVPPQTLPTIGDRLSDHGVGWAWYSGGWNNAIAGRTDTNFQFHHQPLAYFKRYAEGSPDRAQHLKDAGEFLNDLDHGTLPAVSFYKPLGDLNEHPGYADLLSGDRHAAELIGRIESSPIWKNTVVIVTYDEFGGFWDHVPPPAGDRWGPGSRVPALVISPFAKRGYVDHTPYDTTSILKFIETRFGLPPLTDRDAKATNIGDSLDL